MLNLLYKRPNNHNSILTNCNFHYHIFYLKYVYRDNLIFKYSIWTISFICIIKYKISIWNSYSIKIQCRILNFCHLNFNLINLFQKFKFNRINED